MTVEKLKKGIELNARISQINLTIETLEERSKDYDCVLRFCNSSGEYDSHCICLSDDVINCLIHKLKLEKQTLSERFARL